MEPSITRADFKRGDKVRVTLTGDVDIAAGQYMDVAYETPDGISYVVPIVFGSKGVTVVPAGEPDRFERALNLLAGIAANLNVSAKRCDDVGRKGLAIERRTEADAVWCSLIDVIEVCGKEERDAAVEKARCLVAEADVAAAARLDRVRAELAAAREAQAVADHG